MKGGTGGRKYLRMGEGLVIAIIRYFKPFIFDTTAPESRFVGFKGAPLQFAHLGIFCLN